MKNSDITTAKIYKIKENYKRFDKKFEMFKRPWWDPSLRDRTNAVKPRKIWNDKAEHRVKALRWGSIFLDYSEGSFFSGHTMDTKGHYSWSQPVGQLGPKKSQIIK